MKKVPALKELTEKPTIPQKAKQPAPCKVRLQLEPDKNGRAVTRISGLPLENLEVIAARLHRGLGCDARIEGSDLLLLGSLLERASEWFGKAGDLRAMTTDKPVKNDGATRAMAAAQPPAAIRGDATVRKDIRPGQRVAIVQKVDQATGALTEGIVRDLLTNSQTHPRGIKVRLESGEVGRVRVIYQ